MIDKPMSDRILLAAARHSIQDVVIPQAAQATPAEIAEGRRRCWKPGCDRTARLEQFGWRYCIPHYWTQVLRGAESWGHLWGKIRYTEIARHRRAM